MHVNGLISGNRPSLVDLLSTSLLQRGRRSVELPDELREYWESLGPYNFAQGAVSFFGWLIARLGAATVLSGLTGSALLDRVGSVDPAVRWLVVVGLTLAFLALIQAAATAVVAKRQVPFKEVVDAAVGHAGSQGIATWIKIATIVVTPTPAPNKA